MITIAAISFIYLYVEVRLNHWPSWTKIIKFVTNAEKHAHSWKNLQISNSFNT